MTRTCKHYLFIFLPLTGVWQYFYPNKRLVNMKHSVNIFDYTWLVQRYPHPHVHTCTSMNNRKKHRQPAQASSSLSSSSSSPLVSVATITNAVYRAWTRALKKATIATYATERVPWHQSIRWESTCSLHICSSSPWGRSVTHTHRGGSWGLGRDIADQRSSVKLISEPPCSSVIVRSHSPLYGEQKMSSENTTGLPSYFFLLAQASWTTIYHRSRWRRRQAGVFIDAQNDWKDDCGVWSKSGCSPPAVLSPAVRTSGLFRDRCVFLNLLDSPAWVDSKHTLAVRSIFFSSPSSFFFNSRNH